MKSWKFKFVTTVLFLLLTLVAAGFAAVSASNASAQPETAGVQQTLQAESFGDGFMLLSETDGTISA